MRENNAKHWLERIFYHLQHKTCNEGENLPLFDIAAYKREIYEFIDMVHLNGEGFSMI